MTCWERETLHGVVANVLDCDIAISEVEINSRYYVHFRTNTFGKGMNSPSYELKSAIIVLLGLFWH